MMYMKPVIYFMLYFTNQGKFYSLEYYRFLSCKSEVSQLLYLLSKFLEIMKEHTVDSHLQLRKQSL